MRLILKGHNCRYALEQVMLTLFPSEKPVFSEESLSDGLSQAVSSMTIGRCWITVKTELIIGGKSAAATAREKIDENTGRFERERRERFAVKRSFYLAAVRLCGQSPPWGSLTGIRPAKLATSFLEEGKSPKSVLSELENRYFVTKERALMCLEAAQSGLKAKKDHSPKDISLYVGIPFCPSRCRYCSFVSHSVLKAKKLMPEYLESLEREIKSSAKAVEELKLRIKSVYIGGGTPAVLSAEQLDRLLSLIEEAFDLSFILEYTFEAGRPDAIDREKLSVLKRHFVTRVCINPQSLDDEVLLASGRGHTAQDVYEAYKLAREYGFKDINMDLIAGLPKDSAAGFEKTLNGVVSMRPENITVHTLALKKGSFLKEGFTDIPAPEEVGKMLDFSLMELKRAGYKPYYLYRQKFMSGSFENTGWCLPGAEGLYNIYIMEEIHTILSLGAGGVTKLIDSREGYIERIFNPKYPYEYISGADKILLNGEKLKLFYNKRNI